MLLETRTVEKPWGKDMLPAPFETPAGKREAIIGVRVNDTSSETAMAKAMVTPNEYMKRPTMPAMNATGRKTTMSGTTEAPKGPDLSKGVAETKLEQNQPLLGRVGDDAVMLVRTGDELFAVGGEVVAQPFQADVRDAVAVGIGAADVRRPNAL